MPATPNHSSQKKTTTHKKNDSCTKEVTTPKSSPRPLEARVPLEELKASNMPPTTPPTEIMPSLLRATTEQVKPSIQAGEPKSASATVPATGNEARKPLEEVAASNVPPTSPPTKIKVPTPPIGKTLEQPSIEADEPKPADAAPWPQLFGQEDAYKRVLHISKVPLHWTVYDLCVVFSTWYPKVVNIKLLYDQSTRISKGSGFVTFIKSEKASNAVNQIIRGEWEFGFLCNHPEGGLRVSFALPETRAAPYKVWVGDLRAYARRDDLCEHFAACEGFQDAQVLSDINVGSPAFSVPRGHGFMRKAGYCTHVFAYFTTLDAARQAVKTMNNSVLLEQAIRVDWPRSKQMDSEFRKTIPELRDQPIPLRQPTPLWTPHMQGEEAYMPAPSRQPAPAPFAQPAPAPLMQPAPVPAPSQQPAQVPSQQPLGCTAVPFMFGTMPAVFCLPPPQVLFPRRADAPFRGPKAHSTGPAPSAPAPPVAPSPAAFYTPQAPPQVKSPLPPVAPVQPRPIPFHDMSNGTGQPRIINRVAANERTNVYLGNISPKIPERDVRAMLEAFGPVKQLQMFGDRRFGFAHFRDHQAAAAAVQLLNKRPVGGQTLRVPWSGRQGY